LEHSNENARNRRSFNKAVLLAVIALIALIIGVSIVIGASSEKRIMAPGPIGSTDSITKPLA
jgi:hypothetical protein